MSLLEAAIPNLEVAIPNKEQERNQFMHIIVYGPEGSGKGTQGKLLAGKLSLPYLVSGDLVRKYAQEDKEEIGDICRQALSEGKYVDDDSMFKIWEKRFQEPDASSGFIIDGFPRNIDQALFLQRVLNQQKNKISFMFHLKISREESIKRLLKRGRKSPDGSIHDTQERIESRLDEYYKDEEALLQFYQKQGVLEEINGEQTIEAIHQDILQVIDASK